MFRGRKKRRAKKHSSTSTKSGEHASDRRADSSEPRLTIEQLEPRILLSATWVDTDAGDEIEGATIGDGALAESQVADAAAATDGDDLILGSEHDSFLQSDSPVVAGLSGHGAGAGSGGGSGGGSDVDAHNDVIGREKVVICHTPPGNPDRSHTITVSSAASDAHLAHGDVVGECGDVNAEDEVDVPPTDDTTTADGDGSGTVVDADTPVVDGPATDDTTTAVDDGSVTVVDADAPVVDGPVTDDTTTADGDGSVTVVDADTPVVDVPPTDDTTTAVDDGSVTVVDADAPVVDGPATDDTTTADGDGTAAETEDDAWSDPPIPVVPDDVGSDEPAPAADSDTVRTEQVGDALTDSDSLETMILSEGPPPLFEGEAATSDDGHDSGVSVDTSLHGHLDADGETDDLSDRGDADEPLAVTGELELPTYLGHPSADASGLFEVVGRGPFDDVFEEASATREGPAMPDRVADDVRVSDLPIGPISHPHLSAEPGFVPTQDAEFGPHPADPYDVAVSRHRPEEDSSLEHRASDVSLPYEAPGTWSPDDTAPDDGPERAGWFAQLWGLVRGRGGTTVEESDTASKRVDRAGRKMN